jgi:hypothetical protein
MSIESKALPVHGSAYAQRERGRGGWHSGGNHARQADAAAPRDFNRARDPAGPGRPGQLSFGDLLDVVNPLQHIPFLGGLYRSATGDAISGQARVAGGLLYGGPLGLVSGLFSAAIEQDAGAEPAMAAARQLTPLGRGDRSGEMAEASGILPKFGEDLK